VEGANLRQAAVILVGPALADDVPSDQHRAESFLYDPARDRSLKSRPNSST
jgi:precorrin-4/cobalt-precorrin-4 C11-methyltransferase